MRRTGSGVKQSDTPCMNAIGVDTKSPRSPPGADA